MPPKRKVESVEDNTEVPPAKKTSEEETPPISPDKGATGETTTSSENNEAGTQTGLCEEEEEASYKEEYKNAVFKLLKNFGMQYPEVARDILTEALFYPFCGYGKDIVK